MTIQFKKVTPKDIKELSHLQPTGWSDIMAQFQFFISNNFCYSIKMLVDNKIVGVGNRVIFKNRAWLSHIIVGSEYRNRGFWLSYCRATFKQY